MPRSIPAVAGFRFALVDAAGRLLEPAFFNTAAPNWQVGDEFLSGSELRKLRILRIVPVLDDEELSEEFQAVWTVEPVEGPGRARRPRCTHRLTPSGWRGRRRPRRG